MGKNYNLGRLKNKGTIYTPNGIKNFRTDQDYFDAIENFCNNTKDKFDPFTTIDEVMRDKELKKQLIKILNSLNLESQRLGVVMLEWDIDNLKSVLSSNNSLAYVVQNRYNDLMEKLSLLCKEIVASEISAKEYTKLKANNWVEVVELPAYLSLKEEKPTWDIDTIKKETYKRVFVINDERELINDIKRILKKEYKVYGALEHETALRFLNSNRADLILLKLEMPVIDGVTLFNQIKDISSCRNTPIVFIAEDTNDEYVKNATKISLTDVIKKPIEKSALLAIVDKFLEID